MKQETVKQIIKRRVAETSQRAVADALGIHESTVSLIINGKRKPGAKIAKALGLDATLTFHRPTSGT